jgi:hypothetical protein
MQIEACGIALKLSSQKADYVPQNDQTGYERLVQAHKEPVEILRKARNFVTALFPNSRFPSAPRTRRELCPVHGGDFSDIPANLLALSEFHEYKVLLKCRALS